MLAHEARDIIREDLAQRLRKGTFPMRVGFASGTTRRFVFPRLPEIGIMVVRTEVDQPWHISWEDATVVHY